MAISYVVDRPTVDDPDGLIRRHITVTELATRTIPRRPKSSQATRLTSPTGLRSRLGNGSRRAKFGTFNSHGKRPTRKGPLTVTSGPTR